MNKPINREYAAEIMFENFNVPGLFIAVQAALALVASSVAKNSSGSDTGTVIDSGDGVTHIIPVAHGCVIGDCIRHIPIAGRDMTEYIRKLMADRESGIPTSEARRIAQNVKEQYTYCCKDLLKEFQKYDTNPEENIVECEGEMVDGKRKTKFTYSVGYERFLAPEIFFNPSIFPSEATIPAPLPDLVDEVITQCPVDTRKPLYANIVLSGGSTLYNDFHKRLDRDIRKIVKKRYDENWEAVKAQGGTVKPEPPKVKVLQHELQRYAVWFGGSMFANQSNFKQKLISKAMYDEHGPRLLREISPVQM